jgi:hypothetical protein
MQSHRVFRALLILVLGLSQTPSLQGQAPSHPASVSTRAPSEAVLKFLRAWMWDSTRGRLLDSTSRYWSETWATAAPLPLEGSGLRAEAIYLTGRSWCGTSGCAFVVVTEDSAGTVRLVGERGLAQLPIRMLASSNRVWPDLTVTVFGGGVMDPYEVRLRYDGKEYPDEGNDEPKVPPHSPGRMLITDEMPETRLWPVAKSGKAVQRCLVVVRSTFGPMYGYRRCPTAH